MTLRDDIRIDFIGLGAHKAGTTWLYQCLREHPEIQMSERKEINFFGRDDRWKNGIDWYLSHFAPVPDDRMQGEFSTTYLTHSEAPWRIKDVVPNAKLITILRNPVDRALSHYRHSRGKGNYADMDILEALNASDHMFNRGRYAAALEQYYEHFPRDQILVVWFDDLEDDPRAFLREVYQFIGVSTAFVPSLISQRYHSSAARRSKLHGFINRLYMKLRKSPAGRVIIRFMRSLGLTSALLQKAINHHDGARDDADAATRHAIYEMYKDDIEKLEHLTGRNLTTWKERRTS